jgi:hypothetical protein
MIRNYNLVNLVYNKTTNIKEGITMRKLLIMFIATLFSLSFIAPVSAITVATGGKGGFYHNKLYNTFNSAMKRVSNNEYECEKYDDGGTDGTLHNISLVEKGEADVAFIQLGGYVLNSPDVEIIGTVMYEVAHLVSPKDSKVTKVGSLEKKGRSVGMNTRGGSSITFKVFQKEDRGYRKTTPTDFPKAIRAIRAMTEGKLDSYFFVSAPGTRTIKRINDSGLIYRNVNDSDFDDFKYNGGKKLYQLVKLGKKQGYPNKFKSIAVPCVVIANRAFLEENDDVEDFLFDATNLTFTSVIGSNPKKFNYYPSSH